MKPWDQGWLVPGIQVESAKEKAKIRELRKRLETEEDPQTIRHITESIDWLENRIEKDKAAREERKRLKEEKQKASPAPVAAVPVSAAEGDAPEEPAEKPADKPAEKPEAPAGKPLEELDKQRQPPPANPTGNPEQKPMPLAELMRMLETASKAIVDGGLQLEKGSAALRKVSAMGGSTPKEREIVGKAEEMSKKASALKQEADRLSGEIAEYRKALSGGEGWTQ